MKNAIKFGLSVLLGFGSFTLASPLLSTPAYAQNQMSAEQILRTTIQKSSQVSYVGQKELKVFRVKSKPMRATADIVFQNESNYQIKITGPKDIQGITFRSEDGKTAAFFPDEKLHLFNAVGEAMYIPERMVFSSFNKDADQILNNYKVIKASDDMVALNAAYVLDFTPKNMVTIKGKETWFTPRRKYWVDKTTFQVLKEERYWDMSDNPYSVSQFTRFDAKDTTVPAFDVKGRLNNVDLSTNKKSGFASYHSVEEAEAKEKIKINAPHYVPKGFKLTNIQVFDLFGSRIQLINYNDGLNDLMLTIRPEQNGFVTLLAGAFSLGLIKKITDLSYQAPNNYYSTSTNQRIAVSFGDMTPKELQRVASSLSLTR